MVNAAAKAHGYSIRAYHGTPRADRVGTVFRPERATSGPMAYFTSSEKIASNYARDKADTSIAYDSDYDSYETQFRVKRNGKEISVVDLWDTLPLSERRRITERARHITFDDVAENIIYDPNAKYGVGNFDDYELNAHKGNAIATLVDSWLGDGNIYGEEEKFLDVLNFIGIDDAKYYNPEAREEKVYDVFLKITNPFNTSSVDEGFVDSLENWYAAQPEGKYDRESAGADLWDKNSITIDRFTERLRDDIKNGTSYTWTSVPDYVTDYLKSLKYDGIVDQGGKFGGEAHTVYVPFSSEQVKSADPITYDDEGIIIPFSERFNEEKEDIRWSLKMSTDGERYVEVDRERVKDFDENNGRKHAQIIAEIIQDDFNNRINANGQRIFVVKDTKKEWTGSRSARSYEKYEPDVYADKIRAFAHADELLTAAQDWVNQGLKHKRNDNYVQFAHGFVNYKVGQQGYEGEIIVAINKRGIAILHDIVNIKKKTITEKSEIVHGEVGRTPPINSTNNIPQPADSVNPSEAEIDAAREKLFSSKELSSIEARNEQLLSENKSLLRQNRALNERLRQVQYKIKGKKFNMVVDLKKVDNVVRVIAGEYGAKIDVKATADTLAEAYNNMINGHR